LFQLHVQKGIRKRWKVYFWIIGNLASFFFCLCRRRLNREDTSYEIEQDMKHSKEKKEVLHVLHPYQECTSRVGCLVYVTFPWHRFNPTTEHASICTGMCTKICKACRVFNVLFFRSWFGVGNLLSIANWGFGTLLPTLTLVSLGTYFAKILVIPQSD
jgi:hypothetical protein